MLSKSAVKLFLESGRTSVPVNGDPEIIKELIDNQLITPNLDITENGKIAYDKLKERLKELKKGVPFDQRKIFDPKEVINNIWETGKYGNRLYITDRVLLAFTKKIRGMKIKETLIDKKVLFSLVRKQETIIKPTKGIELFPAQWLVFDNFKYDLIVLANKEGTIKQIINAIYYDFLKSKYASLRFYTLGNEMNDPISITIENKKKENKLIGIIAPMTRLMKFYEE